MPQQFSIARFLLAAVSVCLFLRCAAGDARADPYEDIQKAIFEAEKNFRESRPGDALTQLNAAVDLLKNFNPDARDYIREAIYQINLKKPDLALQALAQALNKNPKAAEAYYLRAHVYGKLMPLTVNNVETAVKNLKTAFDSKPDYTQPVDKSWALQATYDLWNFLSEDLKDQERVASEFQQLAEREPDNVKYLYFLGRAHLRRESYAQAAEAMNKGLDLRPDDWQLHMYFALAAAKAEGLKGAILRYQKLEEKFPGELAVKMGLAKLHLDDGNKVEAVKLLQEAKRHKALMIVKNANNIDLQSLRIELAKDFSLAERYREAASEYAIVLAGLPNNWDIGQKINFTIEHGKALVRSDQPEEGIRKLDQALMMHRYNFPNVQDPLDILFELGVAHWKLGKKDKTRRSDNAEIYFRKYLQELEKGAKGNQRFAKDVEIAESLGDLYLQDADPRKAAEVFLQALDIIKYAVDKEKCPIGRVRFKYCKALHDQGAWDACMLAAKEVVADKEYGEQASLLLGHAYAENHQPLKALEQLSKLKGTKGWNDEAMLYTGQALLATTPPRAAEALKYIEEAFQKQPEETKYALEYAQVLRVLDKPAEAGDLYRKVLKSNPGSAKALIGLGDLEKQLADSAGGTARLEHYTKAVSHYKEARDLGQSAEVLDKLSQVERDQARTESELQARNDRIRVGLYTGGLILAAMIPIAFMIYVYRRQWAMRCFQEVCDLERDLIQLIRDRVQTRWAGEWKRLGDEPFRGRIDFKSLRNRAEREGGKDILAVANFGHLVGIIDAGWDVLGFHELCAPEMVDPREVILANLSYVGSCRVCLAHVGKLEELTAKHLRGEKMAGGTLKAHLSQHLHRQVKTSLQIIRGKFNLTIKHPELPVLSPVMPRTK